MKRFNRITLIAYTSLALIILVILICIFFVPLLVIWALNTLFILSIPFTFKTWLASLILSALVYGSSYRQNVRM